MAFLLLCATVAGVITLFFVVRAFLRWNHVRRMNPDRREIYEFVEGALVMGPEGWDYGSDKLVRLRAGHVEIHEVPGHWDSGPSYQLHVSGSPMPLVPKQRSRIERLFRQVQKRQALMRREEQQAWVAQHLSTHVAAHREDFDRLDREVARQRDRVRHPNRYR